MTHFHLRVTVRSAGTDAVLPGQGANDRMPDLTSALALARGSVTTASHVRLRDGAQRVTIVPNGAGTGYTLVWVDQAGRTHTTLVEVVECDQATHQEVRNVA